MGVDSTNVASGRGRNSIRISTQKTYNHGLVILDLAHMPAGQCGTWPAFWMLGPNWPNNGEIDIIEGVNSQTQNSMTLHTNAGCSIESTGAFAGTLETSNCDVNAPNQATNAGCSIESQDTNSYGTGFNANGGGVYATEWTSQAINVWFFPRNAIPSDLSSGSPDPSNWGLPQAQFTGACDIDEHVLDQQLVFDITFCGDWAGNVWSTDATCAPKAATCNDFVQNNPSAFQDTYWLINSLQVFTDNGAAPGPNAPASSVSTATPTSPIASFTTPASTFTRITSSAITPSQTPAQPTTFSTVNTYAPSTPVYITSTAASAPTWPAASWTPGSWSTVGGGNWDGNGWQGGNGNGYNGGHGNNGASGWTGWNRR